MANSASGLTDRSLSRPISILAADGFPLGATVFEPLRPARGTVVVNGAMAVPASYYSRFADHLAAADLRVVTYDYRGVGASRPERLPGFSATLTDWATLDASAVLGWVRREHDPESIVLVGHSFGGQLLGLVDSARDVRGAVLVGAQLGYYGHWPLPMRLRLAFAWNALLPALTTSLGYLPGKAGLGEDVPAGVAEEWASWCRHPDYLMGFHPAARARFARFDRPTLFYSFSDDDYAPLRSVHKLIGAMPHAPMFHRRFHPAELDVDEVGHFGFFRPRFADSLWRETRFFIDDALAGRDQFRLPKLRTPYDLSEEDLAADLAYGRS